GLTVHTLYSSYPVWRRAWVSLRNPQVLPEVRRILTEFRPEIVHAHNVHTHLSYASLKVAHELGARVVLTAHDAMTVEYGKLVPRGGDLRVSPLRQFLTQRHRYNPLRNATIKRYLKYVDRIVAVSHALKRALEANGITNVEVIYNGIRVEDWEVAESAVAAFRERFELANKKTILFGGRLSKLKGAETAVRVLAEVAKTVPNATLLIMGRQGPYAKEIKALARTLGVVDRLIFTGWISGDELRAAYHASDVVAVLSIYLDPFPTITLEAMACGKPVIGTSLGGTSEAIEDGVTGYVVDPCNTAEAGKKTAELLTDDARSAAFGQQGRRRVSQVFSLESAVDAYSAICTNI
ncbi:MAG TPA: glycosyltransferase family 4 protein, partial [Candidatus Paceibacterota bacterium]|nr:glycosyltransferase family 4 protein [Candidatus Paceibacterota bacterium]